MTGPKDEHDFSPGRRFHAAQKTRVNRATQVTRTAWEYEEQEVFTMPTMTLLVRVVIGEVRDAEGLRAILRGTPVRGAPPGERCTPLGKAQQHQHQQHPHQHGHQQQWYQQYQHQQGSVTEDGTRSVEDHQPCQDSEHHGPGDGRVSMNWVEDAVNSVLARDRDQPEAERVVGTARSLGWGQARDACLWYVAWKKAAHRFDGTGAYDRSRAATWHMVDGVELVP